jgi:hypothetical protein
MAKTELEDEGREKPSDEELRSRASLLNSAMNLKALLEKCVASDDPRLKGS